MSQLNSIRPLSFAQIGRVFSAIGTAARAAANWVTSRVTGLRHTPLTARQAKAVPAPLDFRNGESSSDSSRSDKLDPITMEPTKVHVQTSPSHGTETETSRSALASPSRTDASDSPGWNHDSKSRDLPTSAEPVGIVADAGQVPQTRLSSRLQPLMDTVTKWLNENRPDHSNSGNMTFRQLKKDACVTAIERAVEPFRSKALPVADAIVQGAERDLRAARGIFNRAVSQVAADAILLRNVEKHLINESGAARLVDPDLQDFLRELRQRVSHWVADTTGAGQWTPERSPTVVCPSALFLRSVCPEIGRKSVPLRQTNPDAAKLYVDLSRMLMKMVVLNERVADPHPVAPSESPRVANQKNQYNNDFRAASAALQAQIQF